MTLEEQIEVLKVCRDHWKAAFEHERSNVIRLRKLLHDEHLNLGYELFGDFNYVCKCSDCQLVRLKDLSEISS